MRPLPVVLAAVAALAAASRAAAQDSVFGIRGLGFLDHSVSARSAAAGDALAMFDPEVTLNPASLAAWRATSGWAVAEGSRRSFDPGSGALSLTATRFPVIGFAGVLGPRVVLAVTASDFLDRNWSVEQTDTVAPRGTPVVATDRTRSLGGVTDLRAAMAYRTSIFTFGVGLHALTGSTVTTVDRTFPDDSSYRAFTQQQNTSYSGVGISLGMLVSPVAKLLAGASVRFSGRLRATTGDTAASVPMPVELNVGAAYQPVAGVTVSGTVGRAGWGTAADALAAAGQARSRDVWSFGIGAEAAMLRLGRGLLPLRLGYRWRQLPFPIPSAAGVIPLSEHAVTGGLGFDTAGGRATVDLGLDSGSRTAGALSESFTTLYVSLAIRP
jgi:hypothetical protein